MVKAYSKVLEKKVRNLSCKTPVTKINQVIAEVKRFDKKNT